jgi:hypothetical protein
LETECNQDLNVSNLCEKENVHSILFKDSNLLLQIVEDKMDYVTLLQLILDTELSLRQLFFDIDSDKQVRLEPILSNFTIMKSLIHDRQKVRNVNLKEFKDDV